MSGPVLEQWWDRNRKCYAARYEGHTIHATDDELLHDARAANPIRWPVMTGGEVAAAMGLAWNARVERFIAHSRARWMLPSDRSGNREQQQRQPNQPRHDRSRRAKHRE